MITAATVFFQEAKVEAKVFAISFAVGGTLCVISFLVFLGM